MFVSFSITVYILLSIVTVEMALIHISVKARNPYFKLIPKPQIVLF